MDLYTIDLETYYAKDYGLRSMSAEEYIADDRFELISASIKKNWESAVCYFGDEAVAALNALPLAENAMLAQNTRFDALILWMKFGIEAGFYFDTMLMANALVKPSTGSSSLGKIAEAFSLPINKQFITNMLGKRLADLPPDMLPRLAEYNNRDVEVTYEAFKRLMYMAPLADRKDGRRFPREELELIDQSIRMYLFPTLEIDHELAEAHAASVEAKREQLRAKTGYEAETLRSLQKTVAILKGMGVEVPTVTKAKYDEDGKKEEDERETLRKTDHRVIALLSHPDKRVRDLIEARLAYASNIEVTRGRKLASLGRQFGKLRVPLLYYGAHTGRFSGTDGINLQNLGRSSPLRTALRAPRGHAVVAVDAAQVECRTNAWMAGETPMLESFRAGEDLYAIFAGQVFGHPVNKATHPLERFVGKVGELSLGYGAGYPTFFNMLYAQGYRPRDGETAEDVLQLARRTVETYRNSKPAITRLWARCNEWLKLFASGQKTSFDFKQVSVEVGPKRAVIWLPNGMPLIYNDMKTGEIDGRTSFWFYRGKERVFMHGPKVVENMVQAVTRIMVTDVALEMKRRGWPIALTVHDDLIWVVPEKDAQEVHDMAVELLSTPPKWAPGLPLAAEGKIADTYGG